MENQYGPYGLEPELMIAERIMAMMALTEEVGDPTLVVYMDPATN